MKIRMAPSIVEIGEGIVDRDGLTEGVKVIDKVLRSKLGSTLFAFALLLFKLLVKLHIT